MTKVEDAEKMYDMAIPMRMISPDVAFLKKVKKIIRAYVILEDAVPICDDDDIEDEEEQIALAESESAVI